MEHLIEEQTDDGPAYSPTADGHAKMTEEGNAIIFEQIKIIDEAIAGDRTAMH